MFLVDISPDITMYNLLKSQGYDPAYALSEFIDNALQAHLSNNKTQEEIEPLEVKLYFYSKDYREAELKNSIVIEDNGPGITKQNFINAMRPARPAAAKGLSEFGIGMKASAVWFTDNWKLETKPSSEKFKYILNFNLSSLINNHEHMINTEEIKDKGQSGTKITLYNLRKQINKTIFTSIIKDLKEIYQKFTSGDHPTLILKAFFDEEKHNLSFTREYEILNKPIYKKIKKKLYAIGDDKEWKVEVSFSFEGVPIKGFICLRDPGSYPDNPGLVMFRHDRVIQGLSSKKFMPLKLYKSHNKHEAQRVYGEFTANDLPVTYTKDKFEIDEEAFGSELAEIKEVKDLLKQSSLYRVEGRTKEEIIKVKSEGEINTLSKPIILPPPTNPNPTTQTGTPPNLDTQAGGNPNPTTQTGTPPNLDTQAGGNPNPTTQTGTPPNPDTQAGGNPDLATLDEGNNYKKMLIKSEMLLDIFEADDYCKELIKQINWIYNAKKAFKEIITIALRNLLENYLDYTYGQAFPSGKNINFEERLKEMLDSIAPPKLLSGFEQDIRSLLVPRMQGFKTQNNIYNTYFEKVSRDRLIDTLHLSAHKGTNIVELDQFVSTYSKQYNMLLEALYCIAVYHKSLRQKQAKQA